VGGLVGENTDCEKNLYKFFELVKETQYTIESMGYVFLLSTHKNAEFDFMIIENK
jgi:hypothetical protein